MHKKITYSGVGFISGLGLTIIVLMFLGADFSEQEQVNESVDSITVSYKVPDAGGIDLNSLEKVFQTQELPETVVMLQTTNAVSPEYMVAFNEMLNNATKLETQMRLNVPAAMFDVQKEAEAANYLVMFQNILNAKEVNKVAYSLASNLSTSNTTFKNVIAAEVRSNHIKLSSITLTQDADTFVSISVALLDSLEEALAGSVPSQALIDKIDAQSLQLLAAAEDFSKSISNLNTNIQQR